MSETQTFAAEDPEWEPLPFYVPDPEPQIVFEGDWGSYSDETSDEEEFDLLTLTIPTPAEWDDENDDETVVVRWEDDDDNSDTETVDLE